MENDEATVVAAIRGAVSSGQQAVANFDFYKSHLCVSDHTICNSLCWLPTEHFLCCLLLLITFYLVSMKLIVFLNIMSQ